MKQSHLISALCAVVLPLVSTLSHASLINRGGGLIYDDVLDVTWLQDTNYALTSGADDGKMIWYEANNWVTGLSYYDAVRDVTYDDWRLPTVFPIDGSSFDYTYSGNGTTDLGWAQTTTDGSDGGWRESGGNPVSELGYMFYVNLANLGKCDPARPVQSNGSCPTQSGWDWENNFNAGPFTNFSQFVLDDPPSNTTGNYAAGPIFDGEVGVGITDGVDYEWILDMKTGEQRLVKNTSGFSRLAAWAVRDGDVSAVPVPAAVWLFGSGLLGLVGMARRKKVA